MGKIDSSKTEENIKTEVLQSDNLELEEKKIADLQVVEAGFDPALFSILDKLRNTQAEEKKIKPENVFSSIALEEMCALYPTSTKQLLDTPGISEQQVDVFGKQIIACINNYLEQNEIEKIETSKPPILNENQKLRINIIQAIDRKMDLDIFSKTQGISNDELLDHIENIIKLGTKVNVDYFLFSNMEKECIEEVLEYFNESENLCIESAQKALDPDLYTVSEIRWVKIKYLSS